MTPTSIGRWLQRQRSRWRTIRSREWYGVRCDGVDDEALCQRRARAVRALPCPTMATPSTHRCSMVSAMAASIVRFDLPRSSSSVTLLSTRLVGCSSSCFPH